MNVTANQWLGLVFVAMIGCGDDGTTPNNDGDAGTDAADTDAHDLDALVEGPVTVTYHQAPAGSRVVFLTAADALIADLALDASGQAQAQVEAGASVNVITPTNGAIRHVLGVKPGDVITIGAPVTVPTTVQVTVDVPNATGATSYDVASPCGAASNPVSQVTVTLADCGATTDFHVVARSASAVVGTFLVRDVTVAPTITLTDPYVVPRSASFTFLNVPSGLAGVLGYVDVEGQTTPPWTLAPALFLNGSAPAGVFVLTGVLPDLAAPRAAARVQMFKPNTSSQRYYFEGPIDYSDSLDLSTRYLPWITATSANRAASSVMWTEADGVRTPNLVWASFDTRLASGTGDIVGRHVVVGPYTAGQLRVPLLPAPHADFNLTPATTSTSSPNVIMYEVQDADRGRQQACASVPCQLSLGALHPLDGHAASSSSP